MGDGITKQDLVDALREVGFKGSGSTIGGGNAAPPTTGGTGFSSADKAAKDLGSTFSDKLSGATRDAGQGLKDLNASAQQNVGVWRDLSSRGANFGNDIVSMSTAASGSRVSLQDFAQTIADNNTSFIGLGGNVGHGSQKFAALTAEMYDNFSPVTDQLRQQGVSNKELNDILALQVGFQRGSYKDDKASKAETIKAATDLAEEMGTLAQLTGVSRKEQEEKLKKESVNAQVESKFRLIAATEGEEAAGKARLAYAKNFAEAEARGEGQRFREIFATGHEVTKEAAAQGAMLGKQGQATAEQARASAKGNMEEADKANRIAREGQLENSRNVTLLTMGTYGKAAGAAGEISQAMVTSTKGIYDSETKLRQEAAFKNATSAEIAAEQERRAKAASLGKDKDGADQAGSATTKAVVNMEQRMKDAESAVMKSLVTPLNEKAGPAVNKFADTALGAQQKLSNGQVVTTPQANNLAVQQGYQGTGATAPARPTGLANQALNTVGTVGRAGEAVAEGAGKVTDFVKDARSSDKPKPKLAEGGVVEPRAGGTDVNVGEAGKAEAVIPLDKLKDMMGGRSAGISPVGGMSSNEELKAKAEEAIRIIKEHGQGSFDTQIRITESGNLRLREQFNENGDRMQSLGSESSKDRIAELLKQAEDLKAIDQDTAKKRVEQITADILKQSDTTKAIDQDTAKKRVEQITADILKQSDTTKAIDQDTAKKRFEQITQTANTDLLKMATLGRPVSSAQAQAQSAKDAGKRESEERSARGEDRIKPQQSINDIMGDMIDKMAGDIDVKGISKNIKTSVSTTDPKEQAAIDKAEKDKRYIAENKAKEEKEKTKNSPGSSSKSEHKATLDDVVASLNMLNKLMNQQVDNSAGMIKATKNLSGNKMARG